MDTQADSQKPKRRPHGPLAPNPEMWEAFKNGPGLREVLSDFYTKVFADDRLAPFFHEVSQEWATGKQYNFLCSIFTGERVYFGARPRNAHHWMVIDDDLFDYRERLMEESLRKYGLSEPLIEQFIALDEVFRKQIVKTEPRPMKVEGVEMPMDGYETLIMPVSTVCDQCEAEIAVGERAYHHIRTGHAFCEPCHFEICEQDPSLEDMTVAPTG